MRAIVLNEYGDSSKLSLQEIDKPQPQPNEVLIKVAYAGVNPVDFKIREGLLKDRVPNHFPIIPGWDVSGVIEEVGSDVKHLNVGDPVLAYCRKPTIQNGTYAEYVTFFADHVAKKPANISFAQAAAIPLASLTAWQALFDAMHLQAGQKILIQAGAGGVGSYAIQFAKHVGARVASTAREENHDYLKELGAELPIDYTKVDTVQAVRDWSPEGVDAVFELIGGETVKTSWKTIKPGGFLACITEAPNTTLAAEANAYGVYVFVRPDGGQLTNIVELIKNNAIKPPPVKEFSLENAAEAQDDIQKGHTKGKIVLKVAGEL